MAELALRLVDEQTVVRVSQPEATAVRLVEEQRVIRVSHHDTTLRLLIGGSLNRHTHAIGQVVGLTAALADRPLKAPVDGSYRFTEDGWLELWDEGTQEYCKVWLQNGALVRA